MVLQAPRHCDVGVSATHDNGFPDHLRQLVFRRLPLTRLPLRDSNAAVQHYAVSDYFPYRRVANRIQVSGPVPFYRPSDDAARL